MGFNPGGLEKQNGRLIIYNKSPVTFNLLTRHF
jgi:hypothetical protein